MNPVIIIVSRDIIKKQEPKVTLKYSVENLELRERLGESMRAPDKSSIFN